MFSSACLKSASNRSRSSLLITEAFSQEMLALNENRAERRALVADYREVKEARISTNSNYCDVARRCNERRGGTRKRARKPRQTNTFQEKVPATDSLLKRRRSSPHNVFSRFRLCSNRIIEHNNQVCSLLLLLRSICSLRCRLVTTGSHARLVVVEKTEKYLIK